MKIRIESTELKALLEKVLPQIDKKSNEHALQCVLLESKDNKLMATATDLQSYVSVRTNKYNSIEDGKVLIHNEDIKVITKLSGELEVNLLSDTEIVFKTSKKSISIKNYDIEYFPKFNEIFTGEYIPVAEINETVFTKTIEKLHYFASNDENKIMMQYYNYNIKENRMESLDGHRAAVIDINNKITTDISNVLIHSSINTHLKKVLSIKANNNIQIGKQNKHIIIKGTDFIYVQREKEGEYYKVSQLLSDNFELSMTVNTKELMDIAKFDLDMVDIRDKKPIVISYDTLTDNTHIYLNTGKYKTVDKLETVKTQMNNKDFMIGFNPTFIYEAMKCINDEQIEIKMQNPKAPAIIYAEGEKYLILPVNLGATNMQENEIKNYIRNAA